MAKKPHQEVLSALLKKQEALQNRIASIQARARKEEDRKLTRMKILAGAFVLEQHKGKMDKLAKMLEGYLTRDNDRKLFGLAPLKKDEAKL